MRLLNCAFRRAAFFFFFQAEDGIRDVAVTGVQTCALPISEPARRARLRALLRPMGDLERLTSRAALGQAHARDLVGLRACLAPLGEIRETCRGVEASLLAAAAADLADLEPLRALLETALVDEPPLGLHDGGIIRESWNDALGAIVREAREARDWIAGLEERERVR